MVNSSIGYHTFSIHIRMKEDNFYFLTEDFKNYSNKNKDIMRFPIKNQNGIITGWHYSYKNSKGISWELISASAKNGYPLCGVTAIINPKAIIENNYIKAAQNTDLSSVENVFNAEAERISPLLPEMCLWSLNRADYCLNIDLEELGIPCSPAQMMKLIKRGSIPSSFKEREVYDTDSHRKVTDKNSFYLKSKSTVINYYWKYPAIEENHPAYTFRNYFYNLIRFEVQCKYQKLYPISKKLNASSNVTSYLNSLDLSELDALFSKGIFIPAIPVDTILSDIISENIVEKYFYKVLRRGDYFTLDKARKLVESYGFNQKKECRMIYALEIINEQRGIDKARSALADSEKEEFRKALRELDDILVNPVTIPKNWGIRYIPNLMRAYRKAIGLGEVIPMREQHALKHIEEILRQ